MYLPPFYLMQIYGFCCFGPASRLQEHFPATEYHTLHIMVYLPDRFLKIKKKYEIIYRLVYLQCQ